MVASDRCPEHIEPMPVIVTEIVTLNIVAPAWRRRAGTLRPRANAGLGLTHVSDACPIHIDLFPQIVAFEWFCAANPDKRATSPGA
jgi:hypothetical protein